MDLTSVEKSVEQVELEKKNKKDEENLRHLKEVEIYFIMKDYIDLLNKNVSLPQFKLKVIASGYQATNENLMLVFYVANKWREYFVDGLAKCIEEQWYNKMSKRISCNYMFIEVVKDYLYVAKYYIESPHTMKGDPHIFYHNV